MAMDLNQLQQMIGSTPPDSALGALGAQTGQAPVPPVPSDATFDPMALMPMIPPQPQPTPDELSLQVQTGILNSILELVSKGIDGRGGELNLKVFADSINTLTAAYKTVKDADNQQQHLPPELQLEMEQARLDSQLQMEQARLQIEQQRAQMELQIKQAEADVKLQAMQQQAQLKYEQAQQDAAIKQQNAEQDAAIKQQQAELQLASQEDQHLQKMSMQEQQAEMQARQAKDKQG